MHTHTWTYRLYTGETAILSEDNAILTGIIETTSPDEKNTNPDEIAEDMLIPAHPGWNATDILLLIRGKKQTPRNEYLYTVGQWRINP